MLAIFFFAIFTPDQAYSESLNSTFSVDSTKNDIINQIHASHQFLEENDRFTDYLDATSLLDFPIGIKKKIGNLEYVISIDSVVITPTYAFLNASMSFTVPQSKDKLAFRGTNIKFTKNGGLTGDVRLELVGDQAISITGGSSNIIFKGDGTYVEWDCNGFKQFGLKGEVKLSRDKFIPVNLQDSTNIKDYVTASFEATLGDWNDLLASASLSPFEIKGLEGFIFEVNNAVFDFSDLRNPANVIFPKNYLSFLGVGQYNLWRGFYLQEVKVILPPQFSNSKGDRPSFAGADLIIDELGLTARLEGRNILEIDNSENGGNMDGWAFSLDSLGIVLEANRLLEAGFSGQIVLPITKKSSAFEYTAFLDHANQYFFNVKPESDIAFPMWQAGEVKIFESSYLEVEVRDGQFKPRASLNGVMNIGSAGSKEDTTTAVALANIDFEQLVIQTEAPYLSVGAFSFGSESASQKLGSFPVSINNIGLNQIDKEQIGLEFDFLLNLTSPTANGFSAEAGLTIISEQQINEKGQSYKFKELKVNDIIIDVSNEAFKFYGSIKFFKNDLIYGTGFNGMIDASFKPGIQVKASALFGTVDGMRYWYADALAKFQPTIMVFPGFGISGFGGGAYYRVQVDNRKVKSPYGTTASGISYVPDKEAGLGLMASLAFSSASEQAFNGDVSFEMNFFKGGGIRNISFNGNGYFVTPPVNVAEADLKLKAGKIAAIKSAATNSGSASVGSDAQLEQVFGAVGKKNEPGSGISAKVRLSYDFENATLHGNMLTYVNTAGGLVTGAGANGKAGWAVMHFAPAEWYVMIGNPANRIGLNFGIGPVAAQATSYFMVGTNIPGSPPPNENVSRILGGLDLDYMRDENALGTGAGFAFGAALNIDTGDLTFLPFYARFMAGAGFDLMLKNYGQEVSCVGRPGPIGINGWYANGQAYAYFDGKIGIEVPVFGDKRKIDIMNISAAAVLQAKLPNPFWMRGIVGGDFDILGGLIKGECRFEATIGETCDMVGGSVLSGIQVISEVTPNEGESEVNVFNNPQVIFNIPIGKTFELIDVDDVKKAFRIKLDYLRVKDQGHLINGQLKWNNRLDVVAFNAFEILPPKRELELEVQISYEERKNGSWEPVTSSGNIIVENKKISFETGEAPDHIPLQNVEYSYPVIGMLNYYPDESDIGLIKLKKGQSYLFESSDEWETKGVFNSNNSDLRYFDFAYNTTTKQLNFSVPRLQNGLIYSFELIQTPKKATNEVDRNVSSVSTMVASSNTGDGTVITTQQAEGNITELQDRKLFNSEIRTSHYSTLNEKVAAFATLNTLRVLIIPWRIHSLRKVLSGLEFFDKTELEGSVYSNYIPLIQARADLADNVYYQQDIYPLIYSNYPIDGIMVLTQRDTSIYGLIPRSAIKIVQENIPDGTSTTLSNIAFGAVSDLYIRYGLVPIYASDFYEIQTQAIVKYSNANGNVPKRISDLAFSLFPVIRKGEYKVNFDYVIPGQTRKEANSQLLISNPIPR